MHCIASLGLELNFAFLQVATPGMKSLNQPDPRTVAELDGEDERKVLLMMKL